MNIRDIQTCSDSVNLKKLIPALQESNSLLKNNWHFAAENYF